MANCRIANKSPLSSRWQNLKAHKIFSQKTAKMTPIILLNKIKTPYVYIMGELLDEYTDAAKIWLENLDMT